MRLSDFFSSTTLGTKQPLGIVLFLYYNKWLIWGIKLKHFKKGNQKLC